MTPPESRLAAELALIVDEVRRESDGVVSLTLSRADGLALASWEPGAHIDVVLEPGLERQYSLCGEVSADSWRIAVLLEPAGRGGSARMHRVVAGDLLTVRGPRNHFPLVIAAGYMFIAGGIGITPLIPMISAVASRDAEWQLLYGGRRRDSMAFAGELSVHGPLVTFWPEDVHGLLDLAGALARTSPEQAVYCCGPEPLIAAVEQACAELGRPHPHVERFAPKPIDLASKARDKAFDIVIDSTGATYRVQVAESIMQVLERNGFDVDYSCREGICGTCETYVLEGQIMHRDSVLSDEEKKAQDTMMICVSRAVSDTLVLDL
jgi:ferredoxin-NADP reductase